MPIHQFSLLTLALVLCLTMISVQAQENGRIVMPDLVGQRIANKSELPKDIRSRELRFVFGQSSQAKGTILATDPAAKAVIEPGSIVVVALSSGGADESVPRNSKAETSSSLGLFLVFQMMAILIFAALFKLLRAAQNPR